MSDRHVLLLGNVHAKEFASVRQWLLQHTATHVAGSIAEGMQWLRQGGAAVCQAILFAQSRPGEIASSAVEELHSIVPLARLIAVLGTWCEGDPRNHSAPAGVIRVYWHQFCARAEHEWLSDSHEPRMWTMSRTAADGEHLLQTGRTTKIGSNGLAVIHASTLNTYESLADMCQLGGWSTVWLSPRQPLHVDRAAALVWDIQSPHAGDVVQWRAVRDRLQPVVSAVLLGFPRHKDVERFMAAGATTVFSKPLLISDLLHVLTSSDNHVENHRHRRAG